MDIILFIISATNENIVYYYLLSIKTYFFQIQVPTILASSLLMIKIVNNELFLYIFVF